MHQSRISSLNRSITGGLWYQDKALDLKIESQDASFLLAVIGIANTIGRILLGYISDKPWLNRLYLYNLTLAIAGIG